MTFRKIKSLKNLALLALLFSACACSKSDVKKQNNDEKPKEAKKVLRVLSYNVHWCTGVDGVLSPQRIIEVLKGANADIIALNEVDRRYDPRSDYADQLQIIVDSLKMNYQFQKTTWKAAIPASDNKPREFGHAILSKYPIEHISSRIFDAYSVHYHGLLQTKITVNEKPIFFYVTHLDTDPASLQSQSIQLKQWMAATEGTKILMGDMNAVPDNPSMKYIMNGMADAFASQPKAYTFKTNNPTIRIDYILGSEDVRFKNSKVLHTLASDHFPIVTEIELDQIQ